MKDAWLRPTPDGRVSPKQTFNGPHDAHNRRGQRVAARSQPQQPFRNELTTSRAQASTSAGHRHSQSQGPTLRQCNDHVQELLRGERRVVQSEIPRARFALEHRF